MTAVMINSDDYPLLEGTVQSWFRELYPKLVEQQSKCATIDSWLNPKALGFQVPRNAGPEHTALANLSRTPWLRLVVDNVVQAMQVDSIVCSTGRSAELWQLWHENALDAMQIANHRAFVAYGHSYGVVDYTMEGRAKIRFVSPKRMVVKYHDPTALYPAVALERQSAQSWRMYRGDTVIEFLSSGEYSDDVTITMAWRDEELQVTPVVRFSNQCDLDGNVIGEVEPFIPTAQRINKTAYDRLLAQHYSSWRVKYATGLDVPYKQDEYGNDIEPDFERVKELRMKLAQDDILIAENPETKFGTLDATGLDTFVTSLRADIEALAAVSQTPAHALTGQLVNLNAEALAAARAPLTQKVFERQRNASASYGRLLRIAAHVAGLDDLADDDLVRVTWQDMEIRSMSQAVDALSKAAASLGIPARGLWPRIPGVEESDVQEWERLAEEDARRDPMNQLFRKNTEEMA